MALNFSLCPLAAWYVIVRLYFGSRETSIAVTWNSVQVWLPKFS